MFRSRNCSCTKKPYNYPIIRCFAQTLSCRLRRITQIASAVPEGKRAAIMEQLDRWGIEVWENDSGVRYLPQPLWDDEAALTRAPFASQAEAVAYVESVGGVLL